MTFGGGIAMLPVLERELAVKRDWTTQERLFDYYAIGQSTPGVIAVNVATFVGYSRHGIPGAIIATLGIVTPSIIVITLLAAGLENFNEITWVRKALAGINVAVAALMTSAVWKFARKAITGVVGALVCVVAFIAVFVFQVHSAYIILASSGIGVIMYAVRKRNGRMSPVSGGFGDAADENKKQTDSEKGEID